MFQCGARFWRARGGAGQARRGRGMEGRGTSVEPDVNRIQSPILGNNKNAAYEQKTVAGAEMEEVAGREELEAHWVRVCDPLRKENGDKAFKNLFGEVELGGLKAGQLRLYAPTPVLRDWGAPPYCRPLPAYSP